MVVSVIYGIPQITDIMCGLWVYSYRFTKYVVFLRESKG